MAVQQNTLGDANLIYEQALSENAEDLVPKTLAWYKNKIAQDENTIKNNLRNKEVLDNTADDAKEAATRLLNMTRMAKVAKEKNPEQLAANFEKDQLALEEANEKLKAKDAIYETIRHLFSRTDAEIYKQGSKYLIRLRGLTFPIDQATITQENYPLLAEVQKAIGVIKNPYVTIEGHTDSTGNPEVNIPLSVKRAENVRDYLLSNMKLPPARIKAVGYGATRPLAPNTSEKGRALNRRVDLTINSGSF